MPSALTSLTVGLIGCGRIAQAVHINTLVRFPDVRLIAVAEPDARRRAEAQQRASRAAAYADYADLLAAPGLDAVVVCLPNALHAEAAVAALRNGKHVYLEKPLATDLDEARRLLDVWRQAGRVGMMGFNYRFHAFYQTARQVVRSGSLGTVIGVQSVFASSRTQAPVWQQGRRTGGGVLLDLASHHIDLIHYMFDRPVREVCAQIGSRRWEGDTASVQCRLADDTLVQSWYAMHTVDEDRFTIYGDKGKLSFDRYRSWNVDIAGALPSAWWREGWRQALAYARSPYFWNRLRGARYEPSYGLAFAHFFQAIRTGQPASPDFEDGFRSLRVVLAAEESARLGRAVSIE
jgi:predicted dehydrogenase